MDLRVLSLGAGVQSSCLYLMAAEGVFGSLPDVAIFADTQREPPWVYEQLDYLESIAGSTIRIDRATVGDIGDAIIRATGDTADSFTALPFWVKGKDGRSSPGRRQCTREYKLDAIKNHARSLLGLRKGEKATGRFTAEMWIGITTDEAHRAKHSSDRWVTNRFPLLYDRPMSRACCYMWMDERGFKLPRKSACIMCPYRNEEEWARWRREHPELFEEACEWDDMLRRNGPARGMRNKQYVSRRLIPLRQLPPDNKLVGGQMFIDGFGNECEGMCGL